MRSKYINDIKLNYMLPYLLNINMNIQINSRLSFPSYLYKNLSHLLQQYGFDQHIYCVTPATEQCGN